MGIVFSAKFAYFAITATVFVTFATTVGFFTSIFTTLEAVVDPVVAYIQNVYFPIRIGVIFTTPLSITNYGSVIALVPAESPYNEKVVIGHSAGLLLKKVFAKLISIGLKPLVS